MLDKLFNTVLGILNKAQLGGLSPLHFNLFVNNALVKIYGDLLADLKSNVRKQNWHLEGKDLANFSEHIRQLVEHYSEILVYEGTVVGAEVQFTLPEDMEFVTDVFAENIKVDKINYSDYRLLGASIYASPSSCSPKCAKTGRILRVSPATITTIILNYLRRPKVANWTYIEVDGKAMYNSSANDFEELDLPYSLFDKVTNLVVEIASTHLRDFEVTKVANAEQSQDAQTENRQ